MHCPYNIKLMYAQNSKLLSNMNHTTFRSFPQIDSNGTREESSEKVFSLT
jgi:hypothetical protein